jgi:ornithine cyclodeaminase
VHQSITKYWKSATTTIDQAKGKGQGAKLVWSMVIRQAVRMLSNSILFLSEADARHCFPVSLAIAANRKALASLRNCDDGGAVVPPRIGLPYPCLTADSTTSSLSTSCSPADWSLFKPAAYYPPTDESDDEILMGMKLVSIRANNPMKFNKPTVPATTMLINAETGEVSAIVAATYLTAARTAAGSALATEIALADRPTTNLTLVVFGAGLQAELHIKSIQHVVNISKLVIINRSLERADKLKEMILNEQPGFDITTALLTNDKEVQEAVEMADIIATTTNTITPLFRGEWIKSGCHINGVGSYTPLMQEVDEVSVRRCEIIMDTKEALDVGDLACLKHDDANITGLIGDALIGRIEFGKRRGLDPNIDCTFYKSVGTAIQDVFSAQCAVDNARRMKIGVNVKM